MTTEQLQEMNVLAYLIACDVALGLAPYPDRLDRFRALQALFLAPAATPDG